LSFAVLKNGIHRFMEKGSFVTFIGFVGINRVKRLKVNNIGATTLTKIASTLINRLSCDPHKMKESMMLRYTVSDISLPR